MGVSGTRRSSFQKSRDVGRHDFASSQCSHDDELARSRGSRSQMAIRFLTRGRFNRFLDTADGSSISVKPMQAVRMHVL
jgi:hypothetical protein